MKRPRLEDLAPSSKRVAVAIAERLREVGQRAWIVGGAVRDLARGAHPVDIDMASAARPEEVEALFEHTVAVGKAFGTIVIHVAGGEVQLTTFRSERGYEDARRPDQVDFGATPEEDAQRRDFTCNALYLDPLSGEVLDPTGGLADLERGLLRCVGDPNARFEEDGLRLLRLARFAAANDLAVEPATLEAARTHAGALRGVSGERILEELRRLVEGPATARALRLLDELDVLRRALPGYEDGPRLAALERLPDRAGLPVVLATLLDPGDGDTAHVDGLHPLHPSRALQVRLQQIAQLRGRHEAAASSESRADRIRHVRSAAFADAAVVEHALSEGGRSDSVALLEEFAEGLSASDLSPEPLLTSGDLSDAGIPRGPRWGELLTVAETLQLDGALASREAALEWLAAQRDG
jgi:tRNA nucleotidyltransferase/poly(A) polymerase